MNLRLYDSRPIKVRFPFAYYTGILSDHAIDMTIEAIKKIHGFIKNKDGKYYVPLWQLDNIFKVYDTEFIIYQDIGKIIFKGSEDKEVTKVYYNRDQFINAIDRCINESKNV